LQAYLTTPQEHIIFSMIFSLIIFFEITILRTLVSLHDQPFINILHLATYGVVLFPCKNMHEYDIMENYYAPELVATPP
jgi:hypothetical protein